MIGAAGATVALVAGGVTAAVVLTREEAPAVSPAASRVRGIVGPMDSALTINLADDHYLKLAFTVQFNALTQ